jgi:hypothetical protein
MLFQPAGPLLDDDPDAPKPHVECLIFLGERRMDSSGLVRRAGLVGVLVMVTTHNRCTQTEPRGGRAWKLSCSVSALTAAGWRTKTISRCSCASTPNCASHRRVFRPKSSFPQFTPHFGGPAVEVGGLRPTSVRRSAFRTGLPLFFDGPSSPSSSRRSHPC